MKHKIALAGTIGLLALAQAAPAHHSFAAFDRKKDLTLKGTVKEFQWTNPHSWIQLLVTDQSGQQKEWGIETGGPNVLARAGWKRTSLKPGDKVEVTIHPMKDGSSGGSLVSVKVNGVVLGSGPTE